LFLGITLTDLKHHSKSGEKAMDTRVIVLVIIVLIAIVVIALLLLRKRKSDRLKQQFGPEYDRTVKEHGPQRAEALLAEREQRVKHFSIHSLNRDEREGYALEWTQVQRKFVDDPSLAVAEADKLVTTVMSARGYPMGDFEQRAEDISVNYPGVVQNYRAARNIALRRDKGQASTEDLRQALVHYRSLFDELLDLPKTQKIGVVSHERAS
jgi:FtsZ-interacting cell division protein ZipA